MCAKIFAMGFICHENSYLRLIFLTVQIGTHTSYLTWYVVKSWGKWSHFHSTNTKKENWIYYFQERLEHNGLYSCHIWVRRFFVSWQCRNICVQDWKQLGYHGHIRGTHWQIYAFWNMNTYIYIDKSKKFNFKPEYVILPIYPQKEDTLCSHSFNPMA